MIIKSALGSTSNPMCIKTMNRVRKRESLFGSAANNPKQKTRLQRESETTNRQIDQLVYKLLEQKLKYRQWTAANSLIFHGNHHSRQHVLF